MICSLTFDVHNKICVKCNKLVNSKHWVGVLCEDKFICFRCANDLLNNGELFFKEEIEGGEIDEKESRIFI